MSGHGGHGVARLVLPPKPPKVDRYAYWNERPPELSPRCRYWIEQIGRGFRRNRRWRMEGYDTSAELFGVYIWEWINVLAPLLWAIEDVEEPHCPSTQVHEPHSWTGTDGRPVSCPGVGHLNTEESA